MLFTCAYEKYGCKELVSHDNIESHENDCKFMIIKCVAHIECGFSTTK